jgi:inositol oxygenase
MQASDKTPNENAPLHHVDDWEASLLDRYPEPGTTENDKLAKERDNYRNYDDPARDTVREFYRINHLYQTYDFVLAKEKEFLGLDRKKMPVWEAFEFLNNLVDDSDPDTSLSQLEHLLQTAEAIRADGHPDWFILTGLLHDLGKVLCLFGEPQWAVVGDTFPVGCRFSDKIVYSEYFSTNPDAKSAVYNVPYGVYSPNCGLKNVHMSWGHDEYLYHILKDYLPDPALYMVRYHSFYAAHREGQYQHLMNDYDQEMFQWVRAFNPYDLYSKSPESPSVEKLRPYYEKLIRKYLPEEIRL